MSSLLDDVMQLCCKVAAIQQMEASVKNSSKGAVVAGGGAFIGGLLGGPRGIAIGAALGGMLGGWMTSCQFKSVPQIIMELPQRQQKKLYSDVMDILWTLEWPDVAQLIAMVMANAILKDQVTNAIFNFVIEELGPDLRCGN